VTHVEAAATLRDRIKYDPDLARSVSAMVERAGHADIYEWCEANPDMAVALAEQVSDIDGQIANMDARIERGDLS
jgi:hypothetical protein